MGDILDMGLDGLHSYEDGIQPVEAAYEQWGRHIAILGGIDVDFLCRSTRDGIQQRCRAMLERASERGGYALGSGNSIPYYVPDESYLAMIETVTSGRAELSHA
jgi:uroporphyrinogen decarboxylase